MYIVCLCELCYYRSNNSNKSSNCSNTPPFQEKLLIIVFCRIRMPEMKLVNFVWIIRVITVSIFLLNFFLPLILLTNSVQTLHFSVVTTFFVPSLCIAVEPWHRLVLAMEITLPLLEGGTFDMLLLGAVCLALCLASPFHAEATTCNWRVGMVGLTYRPLTLAVSHCNKCTGFDWWPYMISTSVFIWEHITIYSAIYSAPKQER